MKKSTMIILGIIVVVAIYAWSSYNGLVSQNEAADAQWAKVETQYQRRFDLIPNLVASVKGVLAQEQKIFADIADARTKYSGASSPNEKAAAAGQVESALGRLLVIMENYPVLNSYQSVQDLMSQLEGSENRVSVERSRFNDEIRAYNLNVKTFPKSLMAKLFGFGERAYFEAATGAEVAPKVEL